VQRSADNNDADYEYVRQVQQSLKACGIESRIISFDGTGCNDAAEFLEQHSREELIAFLDCDWLESSQQPAPVDVPEFVEA
jgi:hypothetical protein